jgi:hypothetical protein
MRKSLNAHLLKYAIGVFFYSVLTVKNKEKKNKRFFGIRTGISKARLKAAAGDSSCDE